MNSALAFDLAGFPHTLKQDDGVLIADHGGSGADGAACIYEANSDQLRVVFRHKFGPESPPDEVLNRLAQQSNIQPQRIVYGVAAPVKNNQSAPGVHTPYAVDGPSLKQLFPSCQDARVRNDYGLLLERLRMLVPRERRQALQRGRRRKYLPDFITAIGPGTGLGTGRLRRLANGECLIEELEAGHAPLAVLTDVTTSKIHGGLIPWWTDQYGFVNSDTVICGGGLIKLLRYLVKAHKYPLPLKLDQLMDESRDTQAGLAHTDRLLFTDHALQLGNGTCEAALGLFMQLLGRFAQSAAFFHAPRDTYYKIYLGGGVLAGLLADRRFLPRYRNTFMRSFTETRESNNDDQQWLESIPIDVLIDPRTEALHGAAFAAAAMQY